MRILFCLLICLFCLNFTAFSQDPTRFEAEIAEFEKEPASPIDDLIVFTGSSSIRMWKDVDGDFPDKNVINRGFGGSQMSDLLHYANELILQYHPEKVFIYEGDNDIAAGEKPKHILKEAKKLRRLIEKNSPGTEVYFLAAKPSLARWELKEQYLDLNEKLEKFASNSPNTFYVDVWTPMIGSDGQVYSDIFIEDGLHMNRKGYDIWKEAVAPYLE